jgi:hypothetical protein
MSITVCHLSCNFSFSSFLPFLVGVLAGRLLIIQGMDVMMEETFGPVVGIMKVEGDEEALQLMNDSPYGLVSNPPVFSRL